MVRLLIARQGCEKNYIESYKWLVKAANQGLPEVQNELGSSSIGSNDPEAYNWIMKAAKQGVTRAQYDIGKAYSQGVYGESLTEEERTKEAKKWLQKLLLELSIEKITTI